MCEANRRSTGLLLAFLLLASTVLLAQERATLKIGDAIPPLRVDVFAQPGRVLDLSELGGTVVVLEFWATWCEPCVASIPHWNALADRFAGRPVAFVSVTDDEEDRLAQFLRSKPIKGTLVRDPSGELFKRFGVVGRPHTIIVGPDGKIAGITYPEQVTEQALNALLTGGRAQFAQKELKGDNLDWDQDEIEWKDGVKPDLQVIIKPIQIATSALRYKPGSNRLTADGISLFVLVFAAYSTDPFHMDWRAPQGAGTYRVSVVVPRGREALLLPLLQAAISAQFGTTTRWEDREKDVYVLRTAAGAKVPEPSGSASEEFYSMRGNSHAIRQPISVLVSDLANHLRKIVVDETGLVGRYDWDMPYQPGQPEIMMASLSKLGLELVPARRSVKMLVVQ